MSKSTGARARRPAEQREGSSRDGLTEDTSAELSPAGEKIVAAFRETIQSMQSGEPPENRFTASTNTWVDDQITKNELGHEVPKEVASISVSIGCVGGVRYLYRDGVYGGFPAACIGRSRASRFRSGNFEAYKVPLAQGWVAFQSPSAVAADVRAIQLPDGSIPDLPPSRKGKVTETYKIDGTPLVFRVEDEDFFVAPSNPKKAFRLQLLRFDDGQGIDSGHLAIRIAYYMIAHKESRRGKWLFGQFAPMMTPDELKLIIEKVRLKGWIPD